MKQILSGIRMYRLWLVFCSKLGMPGIYSLRPSCFKLKFDQLLCLNFEGSTKRTNRQCLGFRPCFLGLYVNYHSMLTDFALRTDSCQSPWLEGTSQTVHRDWRTTNGTNVHSNGAKLRNTLTIMFKFKKKLQKRVIVSTLCQGREPRIWKKSPHTWYRYDCRALHCNFSHIATFWCAKNGKPYQAHKRWRCAPCLKIVIPCARNSNAAPGIQIWYLPYIFKCCECYLVGIIFSDTLCRVQRCKWLFAGQIIPNFSCISLTIIPFRHNNCLAQTLDEAKLYEDGAGCRCRRDIYENV